MIHLGVWRRIGLVPLRGRRRLESPSMEEEIGESSDDFFDQSAFISRSWTVSQGRTSYPRKIGPVLDAHTHYWYCRVYLLVV